MAHSDTIAAIATAPGQGGVGIVKASGSTVPALIDGIIGQALPPRYAHYRPFLDAESKPIDHGIALYFPAPNSFTGEAVLELQGHGGPVVLGLLLKRLIELGARLAQPGEFTQRAFLNDKLDLTQAEATADLISAQSEAAARAAQRSLDGVFSDQVKSLNKQLIQLRVLVEAAFDFPDEGVDSWTPAHLDQGLLKLCDQVDQLLAEARQGRLLRDGLTIVLAGPPNVGKSSLMNALSGIDTAIVTAQAGTTRDVLRQTVQIQGVSFELIDTAGLHHSDDPIEQEGVRRAQRVLGQADHILLVQDERAQSADLVELPAHTTITHIHNKIDLSDQQPGVRKRQGINHIYLSATSGRGLDLLRQHLRNLAGSEAASQGTFTARARHVHALQAIQHNLQQARQYLTTTQSELAAEELRQAQHHLGSITGQFSADDLLGEIFSSFCIGK